MRRIFGFRSRNYKSIYYREGTVKNAWKSHSIILNKNLVTHSCTPREYMGVKKLPLLSLFFLNIINRWTKCYSKTLALPKDNPTIARYIGKKPQITYCQVKSLKDQLIHSHLNNRVSLIPFAHQRRSTYPCGTCNFCNWIWRGRKVHLLNGQSWTPQFGIDSQTVGVVYYMECKCKAFYVGKMRRHL